MIRAAAIVLGLAWAVCAAAPAQSATVAGEQLFGYSGIETEDDLRAVSRYTNVVLLRPQQPRFSRLAELARERGMRVAIGWDQVLFDTETRPYRLRDDHRRRLRRQVSSAPALYRDLVFQIPIDEPYWNGVSEDDLHLALAALEEVFPGVPTLIIMAWPTLETISGPVPSDWVAFDLYYVADPASDPTYLHYWNRMRALNPGKPIVVVADGFYSPAHVAAGIAEADMGAVLRSYQRLFESERRAVALGVFRWTDGGGSLGSRSLPKTVLRDHIAVGAEITRRCGIPESVEPLAGETVLWFHGCRFFARVAIDDRRTSAVASGVSLSEESGYFWFFGDTNVEISVKVLDGTAHNGHYWVFMSDTTDVNYTLEIEDVTTGAHWSHSNRGGAVSVRRDSMALVP